MNRFRASRTSVSGSAAVAQLRKKAFNSWAAIQDTFFSTKDIFERHRVVFTVGTSIASVATAWLGYSLRHLHDSKVDQRLESIEKAMKSNHLSEHSEIRKIVDSRGFSTSSCVATAGTTLIIGYGLGWRGGRWYANRQFRKEQMKMLGQLKPKRWQLLGRVNPRALQLQLPTFLKRPSARSKAAETATKLPEKMKEAPISCSSKGTPSSC
ncbi:hypothetical protein CsatB_027263 [Cannabis sativa]|uniref:Uncharacterized protein n=1 Tax=Cannabis sativa TaxID=3483 RepID=A0A7J6DS37_CANSA|nr:hypothetical protein F8388_001735 [Cannabis sativa]